MSSQGVELFRPPDPGSAGPCPASLKPKAVRLWVRELPVANLGQAAQELYEHLNGLNRCRMGPSERRGSLEALRPTLELVLRSLRRRYAQARLPVQGRSELVARLCAELLMLAVQGYRILDRDLAGAPLLARTLGKGARALAVQRQLDYLGRLLLHNFELYQKQPAGVWLEIHETYRRALKAGIVERPVPAAEQDSSHRLTVSEAYKRVLLLSVAGPYRLLQGEARQVYRALADWSAHCAIIRSADPGRGGPLYVVDPDSDSPPVLRARKQDQSGKRVWYLDTAALFQALEELLEARQGAGVHGAPSGADELSEELLGRLVLAWGLGAVRSTERFQGGGRVRVVCGLDEVVQLEGGSAGPESAPAPVDAAAAYGGWGQDRLWASGEPPQEIALGGSAPASWVGSPDQGERREHRWDVVDRSPKGYQLRGAEPCPSVGRVGDLLGVAEESAEGGRSHWRVGVVRWVKVQSADQVQLGVEVLAERLRPVEILRISGVPGTTEQHLGSLLIQEQGRPETLLAPPFHGGAHDRLKLRQGGIEEPIRWVDCLERTRSFVRFSFARREVPAPRPSAPPRETGQGKARPEASARESAAKHSSGDEFADLWESL